MSTVVRTAFQRAYRELVADRVAQTPFWMLVGFLPTYLIARFIVHTDPTLFLSVRGVHVHHFVYGIIVLAIVGYIAIAVPQLKSRRLLAALYGIGLALSFDEFSIWIHLTANYNAGVSEDVMTGLLVFLVIAVYCTRITMGALRHIPRGYFRNAMRDGHDKKGRS